MKVTASRAANRPGGMESDSLRPHFLDGIRKKERADRHIREFVGAAASPCSLQIAAAPSAVGVGAPQPSLSPSER